MANQRRLADNLNHYDANRHGVPRQGNALLQGIAICGRCGRRMGLHYSGQNGNYPVYLCRADQEQHGGPRCQEVRALGIDAAVERLLLEALTPDRLALAIAALGELENEARALDRSTLNTRVGAASSRYRLPRRTALRLSCWVRIFPNCGVRRAWSHGALIHLSRPRVSPFRGVPGTDLPAFRQGFRQTRNVREQAGD